MRQMKTKKSPSFSLNTYFRVLHHCSQVPKEPVLGARIGTVWAKEEDLQRLFGAFTVSATCDEKVTKGWHIKTPRGVAELRDYWWNRPDEWSIAAVDRKAAIWVRAFVEALLQDTLL